MLEYYAELFYHELNNACLIKYSQLSTAVETFL